MPHAQLVESLLSASRIDVDDPAHLAAAYTRHAIAESELRAMLAVFGPLTDSLEMYVAR